MSFEPINIKIKDARLFTEVAYVIDRPSFIKEADKIRKKYKITAPLRDRNYQDWLMANVGEQDIPKFYKDITDLRHFLGYDTNYQTVFEDAVLGCDVEARDYHSTHLVNFVQLPSYLEYGKPNLFAIIITPQTDKKDVDEAFNRYKQIEKELQSSPESYCAISERVDKRTEVERDRRWYWEQKKGMTYWQIAQSQAETEGKEANLDYFENFYKDIIAKALKSYKRKLGIE